MSACPPRSSGHGPYLDLATSTRPTPQLQPARVLGRDWLAPSGRRSPEASCSRRLVTIAAVTPVGQAHLGPPPEAVLAHR
jgi:hypothetical protein